MTYTVRPLVKEDLDQVNRIDAEAFPTQWPPANYRQELNNKLAHYLVVCDDTRIIPQPPPVTPGRFSKLASLIFPRWKARAEKSRPVIRQYIAGFSGIWLMVDEAHVTNIAVRKEYRGKGLGELLIIATIDLARELKASVMTLEVRKSNTVAQKLYKKYLFMEAGLRRGYYLDNKEDAIIMSTENINSTPFTANLERLREQMALKLKTI